jgi:hypothetical protein
VDFIFILIFTKQLSTIDGHFLSEIYAVNSPLRISPMDYYGLLNVSREANDEEIKRSYRYARLSSHLKAVGRVQLILATEVPGRAGTCAAIFTLISTLIRKGKHKRPSTSPSSKKLMK